MQKNLNKITKNNVFTISLYLQNKIIRKQMRTTFFAISKLSVVVLFFLTTVSFTNAQEYETDRLFMKEFIKSKCLSLVEKKIKSLKNIRVMTLEQESLLNQNIWSKSRLKLPLSKGEKAHLRKLKQKGIYSNKLSAKNILAKNAAKFKKMRLRCK